VNWKKNAATGRQEEQLSRTGGKTDRGGRLSRSGSDRPRWTVEKEKKGMEISTSCTLDEKTGGRRNTGGGGEKAGWSGKGRVRYAGPPEGKVCASEQMRTKATGKVSQKRSALREKGGGDWGTISDGEGGSQLNKIPSLATRNGRASCAWARDPSQLSGD